LDTAGKLIGFRAIPPLNPDSPKDQAKPDWQAWFPKEFVGFELSSLQPIEERVMTPPDAFDQLQVWKSGKSENAASFYVQAAAYAGKPVYFRVLSLADFEGLTPSSPMWHLKAQETSTSRQRGESIFFALVFMVWIAASVLAWRNFRQGRG